MRKYISVLLVATTVLTFGFSESGECRMKKNLYTMLSEMKEVKVCVSSVTDSSGNAEADLAGLKKVIEDSLASRMTINFKVVPNQSDADIVIGCDILEFLWTDKDPVDNIYGVGAIVMDAVTTQNYGRIQAIFTVTDAKGDQIWKKRLKATITSSTMTRDESIYMLNERLVKIFMRDCLSKTHAKRGK